MTGSPAPVDAPAEPPSPAGSQPTHPHARGLRIVAPHWRRHLGVRSGEHLTLGERAADHMRNGMGSWAFVFGALAFLGAWMAWNGRHGFDPYPFILLNLVLSCVAALQGAILLIAAKRSDQISSELAQQDYATDMHVAQHLDQMQAETQREAAGCRSCAGNTRS